MHACPLPENIMTNIIVMSGTLYSWLFSHGKHVNSTTNVYVSTISCKHVIGMCMNTKFSAFAV